MSDTIANRYDQEAAERAVNHVPPHSLQLERAVLGLMLLSTDATDEIIASDLKPAVFYSPTHQHLYDTILSLNAKGSAVDVLNRGRGSRRRVPGDGRRPPRGSSNSKETPAMPAASPPTPICCGSIERCGTSSERAPSSNNSGTTRSLLTSGSPSTTPKSDYSR